MNRSRSLACPACLVAALLLAGCSGSGASVSGSAGESAKSETGLSSSAEKSRALSVDNARTVDMPALGLMADAFMRDGEARAENPRTDALFYVFGPKPIPPFEAMLAERLPPPGQPANFPFRRSPIDEAHDVYSIPVLIALQPRKAWEVNPDDDRHPNPAFDGPFFRQFRKRSTYDPQEHRRYMEMLAISAIYTNDLFARIGQALGGVRLADPDDAARRVIATFQAVPAATLQAMLESASARVQDGVFTTDLTGSHNVHFTHSDAGDFVGDARGTTWTKAGGVWFGDGRINGQAVNLRLASTASLAQRQSETGTTGASSSSDVSGSGSLGPR